MEKSVGGREERAQVRRLQIAGKERVQKDAQKATDH